MTVFFAAICALMLSCIVVSVVYDIEAIGAAIVCEFALIPALVIYFCWNHWAPQRLHWLSRVVYIAATVPLVSYLLVIAFGLVEPGEDAEVSDIARFFLCVHMMQAVAALAALEAAAWTYRRSIGKI